MTFSPAISMKQFCIEEGQRLNVKPNTVFELIKRGKYLLRVKRQNARVVLVSGAARTSPNKAKRNEVPLKRFIEQESSRIGRSQSCVYMRIQRGQYKGKIKLRRINQRVIFVTRTELN